MTRSEWLESALTDVRDPQLKQVLVELRPLIGTEQVSLLKVDDLKELLRTVDGDVYVCVVWPFEPAGK